MDPRGVGEPPEWWRVPETLKPPVPRGVKLTTRNNYLEPKDVPGRWTKEPSDWKLPGTPRREGVPEEACQGLARGPDGAMPRDIHQPPPGVP